MVVLFLAKVTFFFKIKADIMLEIIRKKHYLCIRFSAFAEFFYHQEQLNA